jgi:hypothetical protein
LATHNQYAKACQGDSGGPLFVEDDGKYIQVGIVSSGTEIEQPLCTGIYGTYTVVADVRNFIDKGKTPFCEVVSEQIIFFFFVLFFCFCHHTVTGAAGNLSVSILLLGASLLVLLL